MMADGTPQTQRPRKRAPAACLACRARKVRCDVAQQQAPCTNCVLDKKDCVVKGRPTKYRTTPPNINQPSRASRASAPVPSISEEVQNSNQLCLSPWPELDPTDYEAIQAANLSDINYYGEKFGAIISEGFSNQTGQIEVSDPAVLISSKEFFTFDDTTTQADSECPASSEPDVIFSFHPFLELNIQSHMFPQDVNFLEQQSCFRVPTKPALDELIREYFLHVHPGLPMLDEGAFWDLYTYRGLASERPRISLFVFQAMLFAACGFVSSAAIRRLGFTSTRAARAAYYRRAKLLFDLNGEEDFVSAAQGTLLLTYNSSTLKHKQNTFWLGIAIQSAKDADAHRYHTQTGLTAQRRNTLKRLWWCCILRDRILPLGVRRPLYISETDFDFEVAPLTMEDFEGEIGRSKVYSSSTKTSLTNLFLTLCSLAVSLTKVIMTVYPLNESLDSKITDEKKTEHAYDGIEACKSIMNIWFEKATTEFPTPAGIGDVHESIILFTNLMYMYYHTGMLALYHHEVLLLAMNPISITSQWNRMCDSRRLVEETASAITDSLKELIQLRLTKYLPISVVAYAALPLVLHVLDVKLSTTESQTARKQRRLNIYTEAMKVLQSQYDGTDEVSNFIGKIINYITLGKPNPGSHFDFNGDNIEIHRNVPASNSTSLKPMKHSKAFSDWGDVLLRRTNLYLRVAITLDLSLSKGRFPEDADFPSAFQSQNQLETRFPLYRTTLEDTVQCDTRATDNSPTGQYSTADERNRNAISNYISKTLMSVDKDHVRQAEILRSQSVEQSRSPSYFGMIDSGILDGGGPVFDHPAAWADGMFLDNL